MPEHSKIKAVSALPRSLDWNMVEMGKPLEPFEPLELLESLESSLRDAVADDGRRRYLLHPSRRPHCCSPWARHPKPSLQSGQVLKAERPPAFRKRDSAPRTGGDLPGACPKMPRGRQWRRPRGVVSFPGRPASDGGDDLPTVDPCSSPHPLADVGNVNE